MENWEFYWDAVAWGASAVNIIFTGWLFYRFIKPFLSGNVPHIRFAAAVYAAVMLFLKFCPYEMDGMTAYAIGITAAFFVLYLIDKRCAEQKIFLAVTFYLLEWITWGILVLPWDFLCGVTSRLPGVQERLSMLLAYYAVMRILYIVLYIFALGMLIRWVHRAYAFKRENMTRRELALILAPSLAVAAGNGFVRYFVNIYEKDAGQPVWNTHYEYDWLLLAYQAVSFAAVFTVILIYQSIKAAQRRDKEEAVLSSQIADMERHIHEVEKLYSGIRSLKHDMRNHIMILENLGGKSGEAGKYAAELNSRVNEALPESTSGNPVTDVILREKQKEAEERGIAFAHRFRYPQGAGINAFDVSVILNNAVDNAIEAAEQCGDPYIFVSSYRKNNAYMIEIKNSVLGQRAVDEESGLLITTKAGRGHGLGLANIRKVARRYYGDIDFEQDGREFILTIMLMAG